MATLEDRILGEKLQYYCSSSEDEGNNEDDANNDKRGRVKNKGSVKRPTVAPAEPDLRPWEGQSTNTGPKGVLKDWQRFKQLEIEKRNEHEQEKMELAKKLTLTCRSHLDDERDKEAQMKLEEEDDDGLDEFFRQYVSKRMEEMMATTSLKSQFGSLIHLVSGEQFLDAVDQEDKGVTVIVNIYEESAEVSKAMNGCLMCLAQEYPHVKYCSLPASAAGISKRFTVTGLPALLVYKAGTMMGNFVRLTDDLGEDFFATDVESFLIEHGMLIDKSLVPPNIRGPSIQYSSQRDDDDSDYSLDD